MNTDPSTEQDVSTESQRQALDAMSADLVGKLNRMIEEQNDRVQAFATQYPQQAELMQEQMRQAQAAPAPQPAAPQPAPEMHRPSPRPTSSVTPPPVAKPHAAPPPSVRPQQQPPAKSKPAVPDKDKGENSIGCGKLVVIIAIIVILLRCCN